jgi:hypothetical protein
VYEGATVMDVSRIDAQILSEDISTDEPVSDILYTQVRQGFNISPQLKPKIRRFMRAHGI